MNKDEAQRCLDISKSKYANGNSEVAIKFAKKSISLHSTTNAVEWLEFISKTSIKQTSTARQRKRSPSPKKKEETRPFTQEQLDGINRIKRYKAKGDLYSILGVTKGAQDVEIKKAYRKV
jgi:DnaJ family protein B protein 12